MSIRHFTTIGLLVALAACEPRPAGTGEGDAIVEPDNTARNAQDRNDQAKTPFDQAEKGSDIATTAAIRREILKTDGLSTNADNIKIITADGMVTLRGVVASESERETVKAIAVRIAGAPEKVDVQLEVDDDPDEKAEDDKVEDKAEDNVDMERDGEPDAREGREPMDEREP
jgi:hypothetical protein